MLSHPLVEPLAVGVGVESLLPFGSVECSVRPLVCCYRLLASAVCLLTLGFLM